jgi:hypothetical protein
MKKILAISIVCLFIVQSNAQNAQQNLKKYWYYRERLTNNFMLIGNCQGCSLPAGQRGEVGITQYQEGNTLGWGDTPILAAEYIGTLATEYKLLTNNSLNADRTLKELYYAIEAINRLDLIAESYWRPGHQIFSGDLNGFYIKDDVPADFVCANYPQVLDPGTTNAHYDVTTCTDGNFLHFNSNIVPSSNPYHNPNTPVNSVCGELYYCNDGAHGNIAAYKDRPLEATMDQTLQLLVGMALVVKCLPESQTYNGLAFADGETSIRKEAIAICRRIVLSIKNNGWQVINPVTGFCAHGIIHSDIGLVSCDTDISNCLFNFNCGMSAFLESYGIQKSMDFIDHPHHNDYEDQLSTEPLLAAAYDLIGNLPACPTVSTPLIPAGVAVGSTPAGVFPGLNMGNEECQEMTKVFAMVAIGDFWDGITGSTGSKLEGLSSSANMPGYMLIHRFLHDKNYNFNDGYYQVLLNEAPCTGPHKYFTTGTSYTYASFEWSSSDRLRNADSRGGTPQTTAFNGEFSGIDYMLLFNLYCLNNDTYLSNGVTSYSDLRDIDFDTPIPIPLFQATDFAAFNSLTSGSSIQQNTVANFRAGKEIHLRNGFHAGGGTNGTFHAFIDNFVCTDPSNMGNYQRTGNPNALNPTEVKSGLNSASENLITIDVYPNPSQNGIFTVTSNNRSPVDILILDVTGRSIYTQHFEEKNTFDIDISNYSKGIYCMKIISKSETRNFKLIFD